MSAFLDLKAWEQKNPLSLLKYGGQTTRDMCTGQGKVRNNTSLALLLLEGLFGAEVLALSPPAAFAPPGVVVLAPSPFAGV